MQKRRMQRGITANRTSKKKMHRFTEHLCIVLMQVLLVINLLLGTVLLFCSGEEKSIILITAIWVAGMMALLVTELLDRQ